MVYSHVSDIPDDPIPAAQDLVGASDVVRPPYVIPWTDQTAAMASITDASTGGDDGANDDLLAVGDGEEDEAGLDALPEYVNFLNDAQMTELMELLASDRYMHLLQDPTSQEFLDLVDSIAPGVASRYYEQQQLLQHSVELERDYPGLESEYDMNLNRMHYGQGQYYNQLPHSDPYMHLPMQHSMAHAHAHAPPLAAPTTHREYGRDVYGGSRRGGKGKGKGKGKGRGGHHR